MSIWMVASGGFFGSIARFYISRRIQKSVISTWIANVTGSVLLACVVRLYGSDIISTHMWLFAGVGFCGAYTTFSTFGNETLNFILNRNYIRAMIYVFSSIGVALGFVGLINYL